MKFKKKDNLRLNSKLSNIKWKFIKWFVGTATLFNLSIQPGKAYSFDEEKSNNTGRKVYFKRLEEERTDHKEIRLVFEKTNEKEVMLYLIYGKTFSIRFQEEAKWLSDTIIYNRGIEKKYKLSEKNIQQIQENLNKIFPEICAYAFEKVFMATFLDFEAKKIDYEKVKDKIKEKMRDSPQKDLVRYAKKNVRELINKMNLNNEEKNIMYVNYSRYLDNLIAIGSASEIGLSSPWRGYHNQKLAQEIADTVSSICGIKKTQTKIYLDEKNSNEELSYQIQFFAEKLLQSKDNEIKEYGQKVKEIAQKIKSSQEKEEILNFKKELRNKIEKKEEIKKAIDIFHQYGIILPEIDLKVMINIPAQDPIYFLEEDTVTFSFYGVINHLEEKNMMMISDLELIRFLEKDFFKKYGWGIQNIKRREDGIKFWVSRKKIGILTDEKLEILLPIHFIFENNNNLQSRKIYQTIGIEKYGKGDIKKWLENKKKDEGKQIENAENKIYKIYKDKKHMLFLRGGWQIYPNIGGRGEAGKLKIELNNLRPGSIKSLFSSFYGLGLGLKLEEKFPFEANVIFNPFVFGKVANSNIGYEIGNNSIILLNTKTAYQKDIEEYKILITGEGGIGYRFQKEAFANNIDFGLLNKIDGEFEQGNIFGNTMYYGEIYAQALENKNNETISKGFMIKAAFEKFQIENSKGRYLIDFGINIVGQTEFFGLENNFNLMAGFDIIGKHPSLTFLINSKGNKFEINFMCGLSQNIISEKQNRELNRGYAVPLYFYELEFDLFDIIKNLHATTKYSQNFFGRKSEHLEIGLRWVVPIY